MRSRSAKMESKYKDRRALVVKVLEDRPVCEACMLWTMRDASYGGEEMPMVVVEEPSVDVHEIVNRSQGGDFLDEKNVLAVCRRCHDRIGSYPDEAWELGLHLSSYEYNERELDRAGFRRKYWRNPVDHFVSREW